jgi:hypothetical protein
VTSSPNSTPMHRFRYSEKLYSNVYATTPSGQRAYVVSTYQSILRNKLGSQQVIAVAVSQVEQSNEEHWIEHCKRLITFAALLDITPQQPVFVRCAFNALS